jgi:hypothetical protein
METILAYALRLAKDQGTQRRQNIFKKGETHESKTISGNSDSSKRSRCIGI